MPEVPLPSWNDGPARSAIVDFVAGVAKEGGKDYVPPAERIATFDNDGTLWNEHPMLVQGYFLASRIKQLAEKDPSINGRQPFKAFLEHDFKTLHSLGKQGLAELFFATHAGMSDEEFAEIGRAWVGSARHPKYGCPFTEVTFKPQIELLGYLRENGFKTYIVTGGGVDFVRLISEQVYGIPREQVIGSSVKLRVEMKDGRPVLMKTAELGSFDDREVKVQNIGLQIGRRPILAFGNSDGDLAMLRYTKSGPGARLALLLHHDDAAREAAYDREFMLSPLAEALDKAAEYGITVVSVKRDWKVVFG
jgi:phosphoglycolate phosphatase-like HAD superfamily hydrolase